MTAVSKSHERFRKLIEEQEEQELTRFVDLCVIWKRKLTGEVIYKAGGKWDRVNKCWSSDPPTEGRIIELNESQLEPALKAAYWMQEYKAGRDREYFSLFMFGNRAAGKTWLASVILFTLLIEFPKMDNSPSIGWQVSSSHATRDELDRNIQELFPFRGDWYKYVEHPKHEYRFVHGATLVNISADDPDSLKRGRVDFVLINEAQKFPARVTAFGIGRLKDKGGFGVFTSNPPTNKKAEWIYHLWEAYNDAKNKKELFPFEFSNLDAKFNENVDQVVSSQIDTVIKIIDPINSMADIEGIIKPIGSRAYFEWDKDKHIKKVPTSGEITDIITYKKEGTKYPFIAGADFQYFPHNAGTVFKVFGTPEKPILWAVDEFIVERSAEDEFLDEVEEKYEYKEILWIGDASGDFQSASHKKDSRDSFAVFKSRRWNILPPRPKRSSSGRAAKNPPVEQRMALINKLLKEGQFFVDPSCKRLILALKECQLAPSRYAGVKPAGEYAHITDSVGYAAWWIVPAPLDKKKDNKNIGGFTVPLPRTQTW